jgi:hypothetical protein
LDVHSGAQGVIARQHRVRLRFPSPSLAYSLDMLLSACGVRGGVECSACERLVAVHLGDLYRDSAPGSQCDGRRAPVWCCHGSLSLLEARLGCTIWLPFPNRRYCNMAAGLDVVAAEFVLRDASRILVLFSDRIRTTRGPEVWLVPELCLCRILLRCSPLSDAHAGNMYYRYTWLHINPPRGQRVFCLRLHSPLGSPGTIWCRDHACGRACLESTEPSELS